MAGKQPYNNQTIITALSAESKKLEKIIPEGILPQGQTQRFYIYAPEGYIFDVDALQFGVEDAGNSGATSGNILILIYNQQAGLELTSLYFAQSVGQETRFGFGYLQTAILDQEPKDINLTSEMIKTLYADEDDPIVVSINNQTDADFTYNVDVWKDYFMMSGVMRKVN